MATWTLHALPFTGGIFPEGLAGDGAGTLVAVSDANEIATSTDAGVTWTLQASPFATLAIPNIHCVTFGAGVFCAAAIDNGDTSLWVSTSVDGVTWSAIVEPVPAAGWANNYTLDFVGGQFVAAADHDATSPDGVTWTDQGSPVFGAVNSNIIFDGTVYTVGANASPYMASAPDAATWALLASTGFSGPVTALAYSADPGGLSGIYIATSQVAGVIDITQISLTADFSAPTIVTTGLEGGAGNNIAGMVSNGALAISGGITAGSNARAAVTADGITWTLEDVGFDAVSQSVSGVVLANSMFIAVGTQGTISIRSTTTPTVPDVTNMSLAIADETIAAAGYVVGSVTFAPSVLVIPGNVISQDPPGGTAADLGTAVSLVISTGRAALLVPDLIGLTQPQAVDLLLSVGLVPGAQSIAPNKFVESGFVFAQNPSPGLPIASGFLVSFIISSGPPLADTAFNFEDTVISQYANSPVILQLAANMNAYIDQRANFANFYNFVWNVDTAVGFGLDIWGKIVDVSRLLQIPNTTLYVGFDNSATPPPDWQTMASSQPPYNDPPVGGAMYTGHNATETYLLDDDSYRQLILAKAFANIATTTAPALNQILQNLYGTGNAWVLNEGPMAISYNLNFTPTAIQLAILEQSGVIPTPPGVAVTIVTP